MKKYKAILVALIIGITGFIVYDNYFKPWNEAQKRIDRYMDKMIYTKLQKKKQEKQLIMEFFTKYLTKMIQTTSIIIFIVTITMLYL